MPGPAGGRLSWAHLSLGLGLTLRHLPFTLVQSPETQFLECLRFSKVQAGSSSIWPTFQGQNALTESAHLGGAPDSLFAQPLSSQTLTQGSSNSPQLLP